MALDGTRTFSVQMRDVMIPDALVLADPSDAYIKRIRAGFVLLQSGMAFGLIRGCIDLMQQMRGPLGHVNKYLDVQPEHVAEQLAAMEATVDTLAATPFEADPSYWRAVIEARLAAGEASVAAAHAAMLHCGARGYVTTGAAQRRLREAYFVAIVTPATKQLKKMLADMKHLVGKRELEVPAGSVFLYLEHRSDADEREGPRYPRRTFRHDDDDTDGHHRYARPGNLCGRTPARRRQRPRHLYIPCDLDARGRRNDARQVRGASSAPRVSPAPRPRWSTSSR